MLISQGGRGWHWSIRVGIIASRFETGSQGPEQHATDQLILDTGYCDWITLFTLFNRPGVAGAVVQTPS